MYRKGPSTTHSIHQAFALRLLMKLSLGAIMLALAAVVPVSSGPLEARASASASSFPANCGRNGQRPCTVLEHIPSCMPGLIEKPLGKRCSPRPQARPIIPRPEQVSGCGANGEQPCTVNRAFPSCEGNLVQDFTINRCRRNDGDFVNMAKNTLREVGPILATISNSAVQCGVDTIMLNARNVGPAATVKRLQELPCFNALLDSARSNGYRTLTIGGSGGAAFVVGAEGENGFAFDTAKRQPITTYHTLSLKFLSVGAGASVTVGLFKKDNRSFGGDAHGAAVGFAAVGGGGAAVWFDYRDDRLQGANAIITAGGRADIAYIRNTTEVLPTQYAIQQALSRPAQQAAPLPRGLKIEGIYRAHHDERDLVRQFVTNGPRNDVLWYRYRQGNAAWSDWRRFDLEYSHDGRNHYLEANGSDQSFTVFNNGDNITWRKSQRMGANSFELVAEPRAAVIFGS